MNTLIFQHMLNNLNEGIYFVDKERTITFWNQGAEKITGFSSEEILDHKCFDNILNHIDACGNQLCLQGCPLQKSINDKKERQVDIFLHHKDGYRVPVKAKIMPLYDDNQVLIGASEIFVPINAPMGEDLTEEELKAIAYTDQLTGVANRRCTDSVLDMRLQELIINDQSFAVVFVDIDHFKKFNDVYGHKTGDDVLRMVAQTLQNATRSIDFVGRWGGEEFIMIFQGVNKESLKVILEKLIQLVRHSRLRKDEGEDLSVTASFGATLAQKNDTIETLVDRADVNMYKSKENGRDQYTLS